MDASSVPDSKISKKGSKSVQFPKLANENSKWFVTCCDPNYSAQLKVLCIHRSSFRPLSTHKYVLENKRRNMCVHAHIQAYKQTKESTIFRCAKRLESQRTELMPSTTPLLPCCEFNKTRSSMPLPIYRMTKAKDARAKPATSRNSQAGGSANG